MQDKIHSINGSDITVSAETVSVHPPIFKITAKHPDGETHMCSLTIGDADLQNVATLDEAQKYLDRAREDAAVICSKKASLSSLVSKLT